MTGETTIGFRTDDWHLIAEALEAEIEHSNDLVRDSEDEITIHYERRRQARLEALREHILSATYVPAAR